MSLIIAATQSALVLSLLNHPAGGRFASESLGINETPVHHEPGIPFQGAKVKVLFLRLGVAECNGQRRRRRAPVSEVNVASWISAQVHPVSRFIDPRSHGQPLLMIK